MASLQVNLSTGEVGMAGGGGFFSSNVAVSGVQIADANGDLTNITANTVFASNLNVTGDFFKVTQGTGASGTQAALTINQETSGDILQLQRSGAAKVTVLENGNLGIGTAAPQSALHVTGSARVDGNALIGDSVTADAHTVLGSASLTYSGTSTALTVNQQGTGKLFEVQDAGTARMTILDGGFAGIGTATPQQALHVIGSARVDGNALIGDSATGDVHTVLGSASVTYSGTSAALTVNQQGTGKLFEVQDAGTARMTILDGGFVGIGTATPQSALHVIGSASVSSNLVVSGNITATGLLTASNLRVLGDYVILDTISSNTEQMVITNDGTGPALKVTQTGANSIAEFYDDGNALAFKVANDGLIGIGTATPQAKLHVVGSIKATTSISSDTQFLGQATDTASTPSFSFAANPNTGIFQPAASNIALSTGGTERMRVLANGNVGIGTMSPSEKMHVQGNILSSGSTSAGTQFLGLATDTVTAPSFSWTGDSNTGMYHPEADKLGLVTAGVERMSVLANGNVGIGTTYPQSKLHVNGGITLEGETITSTSSGFVDSANLTNTYISFGHAGTTDDWAYLRQIGGYNANHMVLDFHDDGNDARFSIRDVSSTTNPDTITTRFTVASGGNVGIGTTNPQAKLHVIGSLLISPLGTQTDPITMVSDLYGKAAGNYFVRWNNGNVTLNEWDGLWLKVHDEGLNANLFTSYWSEGTVTSMTNFGGFGLGYGHGWPIQTVWALKSSDVQNNTLTINNLPKHSFIRYFVRWHSVDSIDNEFNELRIFDIYKVNQFNAMWNSTRQSNISFNTNNVFLNTSSTWTTAEYSYRPWSTGNGTSIIHGYFTIDTNTQVHTTSQFKALHFSGTDQGQEDEAVYYTHSTLYLR